MKLKIRQLALSLFFALFANAQAAEYGPYAVKVLRVIDGDTIQIEAAIWPGLSQKTKLRLAGVNTPEKRGRNVSGCEKRAGEKATAFTRRFLAGAKTVTVSGIRPGKYAGRMLGSIHANGKSLERALLDAGHARPYRGGRRQPWCQP